MSRPLGRIQHGCSSAGRKTLSFPADGAAKDKLCVASFIYRFSSVNPQQECQSNDFRLETAMTSPSLTSTSSVVYISAVGLFLCLGQSLFIVISLALFTFLCGSVSLRLPVVFSLSRSPVSRGSPTHETSAGRATYCPLICFPRVLCVCVCVSVSVTEEDAEIESKMASQHLKADLI